MSQESEAYKGTPGWESVRAATKAWLDSREVDWCETCECEVTGMNVHQHPNGLGGHVVNRWDRGTLDDVAREFKERDL